MYEGVATRGRREEIHTDYFSKDERKRERENNLILIYATGELFAALISGITGLVKGI